MEQQEISLLEPYPIRDDVDLDFAKANTFYATHRMHSFGAKFPPQLADWAITHYSDRGQTVLDPMVGSGTTLVEAIRLGRNALGSDIDPLARLIAKVKSTPFNPLVLSAKVATFEIHIRDAFAALSASRKSGKVSWFLEQEDVTIPEFPNRDYWFLPEVQEELALLITFIGREEPKDFSDFLHVVFSATIITKGKTSVANVMDLAHSRPHYRQPPEKPDVLNLFLEKLRRLTSDLMDFSIRAIDQAATSRVVGNDARNLPLPNNSVDLIFTSPPYVNAIDYQRAHKFSLFWMSKHLGITPEEYIKLGKEYIGTDRVPKSDCTERLQRDFEIPVVDAVIRELAERDTKAAGITHRYFENMARITAEMCRLLMPGRFAGVVVGPSNIKGMIVPTHQMLAAIGSQTVIYSGDKQYSFGVLDIHRRTIDDSKRQLPYIRGQFGPGMRDEFVIMLRKIEAN